MRMKKYQSGLTLIEMMIAMLVGLILVGGALNVFINSVRSNVDHLRMLHLNQDIRTAANLIERELRVSLADENVLDGGANYGCESCVIEVSDDKFTLEYAFHDNDSIVDRAFQITDSNQINYNSGSGTSETISMPESVFILEEENNRPKSHFEVERLFTINDDGTLKQEWKDSDYVPGSDDNFEGEYRVRVQLTASTKLSDGTDAERTLVKTIRVRN